MDTITEIANKFQQETSLEVICKRQNESLKQAREIINHLRNEISQLKELSVVNTTEVIVKSTEQIICETQIEKLKESAINRELTLEETKRLDLLVKNLLLLKGQYKDIKTDFSVLPKGLSSERLLEIASFNTVENA